MVSPEYQNLKLQHIDPQADLPLLQALRGSEVPITPLWVEGFDRLLEIGKVVTDPGERPAIRTPELVTRARQEGWKMLEARREGHPLYELITSSLAERITPYDLLNGARALSDILEVEPRTAVAVLNEHPDIIAYSRAPSFYRCFDFCCRLGRVMGWTGPGGSADAYSPLGRRQVQTNVRDLFRAKPHLLKHSGPQSEKNIATLARLAVARHAEAARQWAVTEVSRAVLLQPDAVTQGVSAFLYYQMYDPARIATRKTLPPDPAHPRKRLSTAEQRVLINRTIGTFGFSPSKATVDLLRAYFRARPPDSIERERWPAIEQYLPASLEVPAYVDENSEWLQEFLPADRTGLKLEKWFAAVNKSIHFGSEPLSRRALQNEAGQNILAHRRRFFILLGWLHERHELYQPFRAFRQQYPQLASPLGTVEVLSLLHEYGVPSLTKCLKKRMVMIRYSKEPAREKLQLLQGETSDVGQVIMHRPDYLTRSPTSTRATMPKKWRRADWPRP